MRILLCLLSITSNSLAETGYVKASEVEGESKEKGAKVVYKGREMTVSNILAHHHLGDDSDGHDSDGDLMMFDLSGVMALAKMIESNTVLRDLKYEAHTRTAQQLIPDSTTCCLCMTERRLPI